MRVAIIHYHLRPGGVTRVIENTLAGLAGEAETVVLASGDYDGRQIPIWKQIELLAYNDQPELSKASELADSLDRAAREALGGTPDLWHIHNLALGKNPLLAAAVSVLLGKGARLLLQTHDFAEDGRPGLYASQLTALGGIEAYTAAAWPSAPQVHYAVLNSRDAAILREAGIPASRCHLLPNSIHVPETSESCSDVVMTRPYLLYPTRGIRRKNLGELVLLAAALKASGSPLHLATTMAPANPLWQDIHQDWVHFAESHRLPVAFAVGQRPGASFPQLVRCADALITTSITEGFGLAYLEPFLLGKDILGRDLPDITGDFKEQGLDLSRLYPAMPVRLAQEEIRVWKASTEKAMRRAYAAYGRKLPAGAVQSAIDSATRDDLADFGRLDESLQRTVIARLIETGKAQSVLSRLPELKPRTAGAIDANRNVVTRHYSVQASARQLLVAYRAILESPIKDAGSHDASRILDAFLDPKTFNLLKT